MHWTHGQADKVPPIFLNRVCSRTTPGNDQAQRARSPGNSRHRRDPLPRTRYAATHRSTAAAQAKAKERHIWSADEGLAFLGWEGLQLSHRAAWVLVMFAGLRRAEACGLRWSDIEGDELHVRRTRARAAHDEVVVGEPKTAAGKRTVPLPRPAVAVLAEWRWAHTEMMLALGERVDEVLVSSKGREWHPDLLSQAWRKDRDRAVEAGVVPFRMTLHDGRHWYGSHLVAGGVDLRTVAEMIGHADPSFTVRTYAHSDDERKRAAAEVMSRLGP